MSAGCMIDNCGKPVNARGRCSKHYHHWRNATMTATCSVDGCATIAYVKSLCVMHYERLRLTGAPGTADRQRATPGSGSVNMDGYRMLIAPDHPLARDRCQNRIEAHRVILFDAIGGTAHPCHWCGKSLTWRGRPSLRICVDHVDGDKLNNDLANLVVSCLDCNRKRRTEAWAPGERATA